MLKHEDQHNSQFFRRSKKVLVERVYIYKYSIKRRLFNSLAFDRSHFYDVLFSWHRPFNSEIFVLKIMSYTFFRAMKRGLVPVGLLPEPDGSGHVTIQLAHPSQVQAGNGAGGCSLTGQASLLTLGRG
jgi:hypothetical protein